MKNSRSWLRAGLLLVALTSSALAQTYNVTDLGTLNGAPTYATAINENGVIAGYSLPDATSARAWVWKTGAGLTDAGSFGGADNRGAVVGVDGRLYGYSQNAAGVQRGFVFDPVAQTLTDLGSLAAGDAVAAQGVNAGGTVVGFTTTGGATLGFKLTDGAFTTLGTLAGADDPATSAAYDINDAGRIVGVASWLGGGTRAFRTDATGAIVSLGTLGANDSFATAINAGGQVAGYSVNASNMTHAFVYNDAGGMRDLGVLTSGVESHAYGLDDAGDVVGSSEDSAGNARAFLWMPGGLRDLNDLIPPNSGWVLKEARDINNSGDIVGYGTINGVDHAFLLERFDGADTFAPVAVATVTQPGQGSTYTQVAVKFWDNEKVVSATARAAGAIRVTGPNNYDMPGTANSWTTNDSQIVNVTFNVPAPGGTWDPSDNGTYEVRVVTNQVSDIAGNKHPGGVIATFSVGLQTAPTFNLSSLPTTTTLGTSVSVWVSATSSFPSAAGDQFTYTIDWDGDGASYENVIGVSGIYIPHSYTSLGTHVVRARCTDPHGVQSSERSMTITVSNNPVPALAETIATQVGYYSSLSGVVAAVKGGTIYMFGGYPQVGVDSDVPIVTWNYLTPGAQFTFAGSFTIGPVTFEGAAVDGRQRVIVWGGISADDGNGPVASARSYAPAGGSGSGSVASMPAARSGAVAARDGSGRIYSIAAGAGLSFRYNAGTAAASANAWSILPDYPGTVAPTTASFDGLNRIVVWGGNTVWVFDVNANAWTQLANSPVANPRSAVLGADGLVYLFNALEVWTFDPSTNTAGLLGATTYPHAGLPAVLGTDGYVYLPNGAIERIDTRATNTRAPRISSSPAGTTIVQGNLWTYQVVASGKPAPAFSIVRGPAGLTINSATGLASWTPALAQAGPQTALVRASNASGMAEQLISFNILGVAPDVTAPTAPTNVTVLPPPQLTTNSADITWSPSTDNVGVAGYTIYRRHAVYGGRGSTYRIRYSAIGSTTGTSFHFANLPLCSTSIYYIAALDAAGNRSAYSPVAIKVICVPAIYGGLGGYAIEDEPYTSATVSASGNPLPTLTPTAKPIGSVWHSTAANAGYFTWSPAFGQGDDANYVAPTQPAYPGAATFSLSASNVVTVAGGATSGGTVAQTYTVPVWPKGTDLIPPNPVTGVAVDNVTADSVHVTWLPTTDNYGVAAYRVVAAHRVPRSRFHHLPYNDHIVTVDLPGNATQTTIAGLRPSTGYSITVSARDAAGIVGIGQATGLWSTVWYGSGATIYTRPLPFAVPNVQQTVNTDGSLTMTWPNQGYYWRYTVQCTDSLATPNWQPVPPVSQWPSFYINSFTFTPDPAVSSRFYRVYATPGL